MKRDYFGNEVKVGDMILRCKHGELEKREVIGINENYLKLKREHDHEMNYSGKRYNRNTNSYTDYKTDLSKKPIYWHGWNKSFIILRQH